MYLPCCSPQRSTFLLLQHPCLAVQCYTTATTLSSPIFLPNLLSFEPAVESSWQWHYSCSAAAPLDVLNYFALLCSAQLQYSGYDWQQP
jgi:hypothetical protein